MSDVSNSFWGKKEGTTAKGLLIIAIAAGVWFWAKIAAFVVMLLANTLTAIALGAVILLIVYCIINNSTRTAAWLVFQLIMKAITSALVNINPIRNMEIFIDDMVKKRASMNDQITKLSGDIGNINDIIKDAAKKAHDNMTWAATAKSMGKSANEITLYTRESEREQALVDTLTPKLNRMVIVKKVLDTLYENAGILIEDTKADVRVKKIEYAAVKIESNALKSAMSIFKGDPDKRAIFDQSMEIVTTNINFKEAEIDRFMQESERIISSIDVQNQSFSEEGLKKLEEMGNKSVQVMLAPMGEKMNISDSADDKVPVSSHSNSFNDVFNK